MQIIQPSKDGTIIAFTVQYVLDNLEILRKHDIPVYRGVNTPEGAIKPQRIDPSVAKTLPAGAADRRLFLIDSEWQKKLFLQQDAFDQLLEPIRRKSAEEKATAVRELKAVMGSIRHSKDDTMTKAHLIMDTVQQTLQYNKAALRGKPEEVTAHEKSIAKDTEAIVEAVLEQVEKPEIIRGLFATFQSMSNGQTINHQLRVFTSFSGFLKYYNRQHASRFVADLRQVFPEVYRDHYRKLLPKVLESKFTSDNLLEFPSINSFDGREYALGAFLHDIGKMGNIDYFESASKFDATQIQEHVFLSAGLILMNYGNTHDVARLMAGDHHNALGKANGYGLTRREREVGVRKLLEPEKVLASKSLDFVSGLALGFLPTEMLAVTDVYDAMIDPSREYKKPMTSTEAVIFLEDTMVAEGKLDPVLVDLYIDFLRSQGIEVPRERGFQFKLG